MSRQEIKRLLALLKAQVEYDRTFEDMEIPEGFIESFESQKHFKGWINYHVSWDVDDNDPWLVIPLSISRVQEWNQNLKKVIPVITPDGEIVEAKEWEKRSHSMK